MLSVIFANDSQYYSRFRVGGGILSSLLSRSSEARSPQTLINAMVTDGDIRKLKTENKDDGETRRTTQEPGGHQCKLIKQVTMIYERQLRQRQIARIPGPEK